MTKRQRILSDHKKRGSKLVTPFNAAIGPTLEVSWVKTGIPEILAFALIQQEYGHHYGVELITALMRSARNIRPPSGIFWGTSSIAEFSPEDGTQLRQAMASQDMLAELQEPLAPLVTLYPQCPLRCLFETVSTEAADSNVQKIKQTVSLLYEREARDTTLFQANAVWLMFDADNLKVAEGLALARFPEVDRYPDTEISRKIGGAIRATINQQMGWEHRSGMNWEWPRYFWNRSLEIDRCEFSHD